MKSQYNRKVEWAPLSINWAVIDIFAFISLYNK